MGPDDKVSCVKARVGAVEPMTTLGVKVLSQVKVILNMVDVKTFVPVIVHFNETRCSPTKV